MKKIGINAYCQIRHSTGTRYSEYIGEGGLDQVAVLAMEYFESARSAEKNGTVLIRVPPEGFLSPVVRLEAGDDLVGTFDSRIPNEAPRKEIGVFGKKKSKAVTVDLVLYSGERLRSEKSLTHKDSDWELVTILAHDINILVGGTIPPQPQTMMYNRYAEQLPSCGGSPDGLSATAFDKLLLASFLYWHDRAIAISAFAPTARSK